MTAIQQNPHEKDEVRRNLSTMYWIIGLVVVVLAVIGLFTYNGGPENRQSERLAQDLTQRYQEAGLTAPDQDLIVRSLGTDGGAVCANPLNALGKAHLLDQLSNGANVGRRPVIVDPRILQGELLILQTYCPDKAQQYQDKIDQLKTDSTINT
jgi:hypothetical protein